MKLYYTNNNSTITYSTDICLRKANSFTLEYKHWLESDHNNKIRWENMARRRDNIANTTIELENELNSYINTLFSDRRICGMAYCLLQEAKNNIDFCWIAECFRRGI